VFSNSIFQLLPGIFLSVLVILIPRRLVIRQKFEYYLLLLKGLKNIAKVIDTTIKADIILAKNIFLFFNYDLLNILNNLSDNSLSNHQVTTLSKIKYNLINAELGLKNRLSKYFHFLSNSIFSFFFHEVYLLWSVSSTSYNSKILCLKSSAS